jgi:general secretion pathway protein N
VPVFYAPADLIGPGGQIGLSTPALEWSRKGGVTGTAEVIWRDAASSFSSVRPLGDYRLSLEGQGELRLETTRGDLRLTGQGTLDSLSGVVRFTGLADAQSRVTELSELLKLIGPGPEAGPRSFHLEFSIRS